MRRALAVMAACMVILVSSAAADIPKLINYQGMLTDAGGIPLNGPQNLIFRIYDDTTGGGTLQWSETRNGVPVDHGLFNVVLGQSAALNLAFDKSYWLEVEVQGEIMPRIRITSMGYAYRASVADSARVTTPGSGSNWSLDGSVLQTNEYWGIARGGAGNVLYGDSAHTMVNLGVACTTGAIGQNCYYSTVGGGYGNRATAWCAVVGGGMHNIAASLQATVGGGLGNNAGNEYATVGGGNDNNASGYISTICGGATNQATGWVSTLGGGWRNESTGHMATVGGGSHNFARGAYSVVAGGGGGLYPDSNSALGDYSTIPGGRRNVASGNYSFAAGRRAHALHHGSFVWADSNDVDFASTGDNQFLIRASGGVGIGTTSPSSETKLHVRATSDDFGVLVDAQGGSGTEIGLHAATSQFSSLVKNAYFHSGAWQRFNTSKGAYLHEITPTGEVRLRVIGSGTNPITWINSLTIEENGEVGILTTDPTEELDVNGGLRVRGLTSGSGTNVVVDGSGVLMKESSSRRYKQSIRKLEVNSEKVLKLNPVSFKWKTNQGEDVGLIAEEVEQVLPELVVHDAEGRPDAVKYDKITLYLLELVKSQQERISDLEREVAELKR